MKQIYTINPEALMFGTDLPSTRAPQPFSLNDVKRFKKLLTKKLQPYFYQNAQHWYQKN